MASTLLLPLQTRRLRLKALTVADAERLFEYRSHPEVTKFQGWAPKSLEDAVSFIEHDICHNLGQPDTWFQLGIFLGEDSTVAGNLIGDMGLHFLPEKIANGESESADPNGTADPAGGVSTEVEIGVTVDPAYQGQGFATEAIRAILDFLFETLHKTKVIASVDPENHKSMTLMQRAGFQLECINKSTILFRGIWTDDAVFIFTKEHWQNRPGSKPESITIPI